MDKWRNDDVKFVEDILTDTTELLEEAAQSARIEPRHGREVVMIGTEPVVQLDYC